MRDTELLQHFKPEPPTAHELECVRDIGLLDYEVYGRKLEVACWEARDAFMRMGVSPMIQGGDVAVGLYTASGDLATAVVGTQLHLVNGVLAIKYALRYFRDDPSVGIKQGDIFFVNDSSYGGIHNSDQIVFVPIFHEDDLVAWAAAASHEVDTGASEPGGHPASAKSRYEEGMRIAPMKIGEGYTLRQDILDVMENFVRDPRAQTLDTKARTAVCYIIERRVKELIEKKGVALVVGIMRRMIDETAEAARKRIASLNDGTYREIVFMDCVGHDRFGLVRAAVNVHKVGDKVIIDFTGTTPRAIFANFNTFPHCMIAMSACYLYQFLFWDLKQSNGVYVPIEFVFPKGCFLDADPDDAISLGVSTIAYTSTALHNAFEKMLFGSEEQRQYVLSSWPGAGNTVAVAGVNKYGMPFAGWDQGIPNGQGMGAKHDGDGTDVAGFIYCPVGEFVDSELVEAQYPLVPLFRSRYWKDGHGFGKYRGGRTIAAAWLLHGTPMAYGVSLSGYGKFPTNRGLFGGYSAPPLFALYLHNNNLRELIAQTPEKIPYDVASLVHNVQGQLVVKHTKSDPVVLREGDILCTMAPGGPGYGDAIERDPELVMKDLKENSISDWVASNVYKVAYDPTTRMVDEAGTRVLRNEELQDRLRRGKPHDEFVAEWSQRMPKEAIIRDYGSWPGPALAGRRFDN